jgi:replicative DNA helicase
MAGFNDTMELERALLNLLLKSKIVLRQHIVKLKPAYFTTKERQFIRDCIQRTFGSSKGLLTKDLFDYDVRSRIDEGERHYYEGEWILIDGLTVASDAEVLLDRLHKADIGRQLLTAAEKMVESVEKGQIDDAVRHLRNSTVKIAECRDAQPIVELTDYRPRLDIIMDKRLHPEKYLGIKTGFKTFDERTGGLFPCEMTLISGVTGQGKSTLMKQIGTGVALYNHNRNVLHICNEEHLLQVQTKFDAQVTRIPYSDFKRATITDDDLEKWKKVMEIDLKRPNIGRIFIKEVPAFTDVLLMEEAIHELENQGIHIHVVIIDHLPHVRPKEQAWGEYDEQGKAAADCKELGRAYHLSVVVATQAATIVEEKQTKGRRAGKLDVYGSKEQVHVANTSAVITLLGSDKTQTDREEWEQDVYWLCDIKKNRDGATFNFKLKHHVRYGYVEEIFDKATPVAAKDAIDDTLKEEEEEKAKKAKPQTVEPEKKTTDTTPAPVPAEPSPAVVSVPETPVPETPAPKVESEPTPVAEDPPPSLMVAPLSARKKKVG